MTISVDLRERVRQYANCACEFCGVSETDTGGRLTIDHYQPRAKGGSDRFENLLYCCSRCNQYKMDYWPESSNELFLWNPREEPFLQHFLEVDDGTLHPLTDIGELTLKRLRLNRPQLLAYRSRKRQQEKELHLLARYKEIVELLEHVQKQTATMLTEQQELLAEQRELLQLLLRMRH